jgi:hypothetical protein
MTAAVCLLTGFVAAAQPSTTTVPPPQEQIAAAVLAAPEDLREGAGALGYDQSGKLVTLREARNEILCLVDTPGDARFSAACYHKDLEPYMARGRELRAEGITGQKNYDIRWREIEEGKLKMARDPRTLYVLEGTGFDAATGTVKDPYRRWVFYWPYATPESTGLSTKPQAGTPWLMYPGKAGAHIMINPPKGK